MTKKKCDEQMAVSCGCCNFDCTIDCALVSEDGTHPEFHEATFSNHIDEFVVHWRVKK